MKTEIYAVPKAEPDFIYIGLNDREPGWHDLYKVKISTGEKTQIVIALRDRGFPIEYLLANDEGHGFRRPLNAMAMMVAAERFLAKHLGGRYQEAIPPEIAARLKQITIDPKTVMMAK